MPMKLIQMLESKASNKPYDVETYISIVDHIIFGVYQHRYKKMDISLGVRQKINRAREHLPESGDRFYREGSPSEERKDFRLGDGSPFVEFEHFRNLCWDRFESPKFRAKLCDFNSQQKDVLKKRIWARFESIMQQEIYKLVPGLETRKKQINRVLKPLCISSGKSRPKVWKLVQYKNDALEPANLEKLNLTSFHLKTPPPKPHFPPPGSQRGPSIKDEDMKVYLVDLLVSVGGMTTRNALLSHIQFLFGLLPAKEIVPTPAGGESNDDVVRTGPSEDQITLLALSETGIFVGGDILIAARELFNRLDAKEKKVFHADIFDEKSVKIIAENFGIKQSTVYFYKDKIKNRIIEYFHSGIESADWDKEEVRAVIQLVSRMIDREKEKNDHEKKTK